MMVPQQVHLHGQRLGKRQHECPPTWSLFDYLLHYISVCFLRYNFQHFWAEEYFKYIPGRTVLGYMEIFLFILGTLEKVGFWTEFLLSILKSELARSGTALRVLFLPLPSFHWKTSFSSLLLKGEFTLHVSLSKSSLKLPPSESESFKISLIFFSSDKMFVKYIAN